MGLPQVYPTGWHPECVALRRASRPPIVEGDTVGDCQSVDESVLLGPKPLWTLCRVNASVLNRTARHNACQRLVRSLYEKSNKESNLKTEPFASLARIPHEPSLARQLKKILVLLPQMVLGPSVCLQKQIVKSFTSKSEGEVN